jgi:LysM repeat protein
VQIALELCLALIIVTLPFSVQAGIFTGWLTEEDVEKALTENTTLYGPSDIELLSSTQNPNSSGVGGGDLIVDENALVSTGPIGEDEMAALGSNEGEITVYTVREGDSLSQVAEMFGVTANTIKWANDLAKGTDIQPGDTLVILPIAGVSHIVKKGDTISTIAKKYEGDIDEILSYNQLDSESDIIAGDTLIIPGGELHTATTKKGNSATPTRVTGGGSAGAGFIHPAPGSIKTQGIHGYNAVDLAGGSGSTIRAAAAGEVIIAKGSGWNGGYGSYVVVRHSNGTQTLYAHLSSLSVGVGEYVDQAQTIGGMGNTGKSTGTHLHFEVRGGRNPF